MNPKHTPEPWRIYEDMACDNLALGDLQICDKDKEEIAVVRFNSCDSAENAARIVACVNAFAGIADPEAAIRAAREALAWAANHVEWSAKNDGEIIKINLALAMLKGGK